MKHPTRTGVVEDKRRLRKSTLDCHVATLLAMTDEEKKNEEKNKEIYK
jgi:hypothetical protein